MDRSDKKLLAQTSTKDESNMDSVDLASIDPRKEHYEKFSKFKLLQNISKIDSLDAENIIAALDKNFGMDLLTIPDESTDPSEESITMSDELASPVKLALSNSTTLSEHR